MLNNRIREICFCVKISKVLKKYADQIAKCCSTNNIPNKTYYCKQRYLYGFFGQNSRISEHSSTAFRTFIPR